MKTVADPIEQALDDALDMTFPASDPIAVFVPTLLPAPRSNPPGFEREAPQGRGEQPSP
jgi:hypothetical protein